MAVEDFGGNVLGRPIEIVFADHQNKADLAGSIATKWFERSRRRGDPRRGRLRDGARGKPSRQAARQEHRVSGPREGGLTVSDRYAVIGNPIGHSKSPMIHRAFAAQTGQDLEYTAIEASIGGFAAAVTGFRAQGGRGLNITAPFKLDAFAYATKLLERARLAGATNAMLFVGDEVEADNFDGVGLLRDLEQNHGILLRGKRVLLLGAGGAARGALQPFLEARPAELVIVNRTVAKANALGEEFAPYGAVITTDYDTLAAERPGRYDVVVNATSASLRGELPPVPKSVWQNLVCLRTRLWQGADAVLAPRA